MWPVLALTVALTAGCAYSPTAPDRPVGADEVTLGFVSHRATTELVTTPLGRAALRVVVRLRNHGPSPIEVRYGGCFTRLLAYSNLDRSGPPVWDSFEKDPVCSLALFSQAIDVGASVVIASTTLVDDILGRSPRAEGLPLSTARTFGWLPNGRYYFTFVVSTNLGTAALTAGGQWLTD